MCHDGRFGVHRKLNRFIFQPVRTVSNRFNSILILLRQLIATWTGSPREPFRNGWGKNQIRLPYYSAVNYKQDGGTRSAKTNGRTTTRSYQERERRKQREEEEEEWKKGETKNLRKTYVSHIHNLCCLVFLLFFYNQISVFCVCISWWWKYSLKGKEGNKERIRKKNKRKGKKGKTKNLRKTYVSHQPAFIRKVECLLYWFQQSILQ